MAKWLSVDEQKSWRSIIAAWTRIDNQLNKDLQSEHGLTMADYEILVRLSEVGGRRMRMSELAETTLASRSRLSHQIGRMEAAGLVARAECTEDRRGSFAVLTDAGWQALVTAAPDHVASVRKYLVDVLTQAEFKALGESCLKVAESLEDT